MPSPRSRSPFYRSQKPSVAPVVNTGPLEEAYAQERGATDKMNSEAQYQDLVQQDAQQQEAKQKEIASQQKANIAAAKKAGVETQVDTAGNESIKTRPDGSPFYAPGFQGGAQTVKKADGTESTAFNYRTPAGTTTQVDAAGIRRKPSVGGGYEYEFDMTDEAGQKQTVRQLEESSKPLFKVDEATGKRIVETIDPATGSVVPKDIGYDPEAAAKATIARQKQAWETRKTDLTFQANVLRDQKAIDALELEPIKTSLSETEKQLEELQKKRRYENRDGNLFAIEKINDEDFPTEIVDDQEKINATKWLANKERLDKQLADIRSKHDPINSRIEAAELQAAKLAKQLTIEGHRAQVIEREIEKKAKVGVRVWETDFEKRIEAAQKDPRFTTAITEGVLSDEANPLAEVAKWPELPATNRLMGELLQNTPLAYKPGVPFRPQQPGEKALPGLGGTLPLNLLMERMPTAAKNPDGTTDITEPAKTFGVVDPAAYHIAPDQDGNGAPIVRTDTGITLARVTPDGKALKLDPGSLASEDTRALIARANETMAPVFNAGPAQPFTPQEKRDYFQVALQTVASNDEAAMETAQTDIPGIRKQWKDGRLSAQDAKFLLKEVHGVEPKSMATEDARKELAAYVGASKILSNMWSGPNANPVTKKQVVDRFMDEYAQAAQGGLLYDGKRLEELRTELRAQFAPPSNVVVRNLKGLASTMTGGLYDAPEASLLEDTPKMLLGSFIGLGGNVIVHAPEAILQAATLGGYEGSESLQLMEKGSVEWMHNAAGFMRRLRTEGQLDGELATLKEWANQAEPGDEVPEEIAKSMAKTTLEAYHGLSTDGQNALDRETSEDTFNPNKDPILAQRLNRYLNTRSPDDWEAFSEMLARDGKSRALADRVQKYINRPQVATDEDVMDRAEKAGITLTPEKAAALRKAAATPAATREDYQRTLKMAENITGLKGKDAELAIELFTGEDAVDPTSLYGYIRGGFQAPIQEIGTEAASWALTAGLGKLAATGIKGAVRGTAAAARRTSTAGYFASKAANLLDDYTRFGMFKAKFGSPLTGLQRTSNAAVSFGKAATVQGVDEFGQEGIMAVGEPGSNLGTVLEQGTAGAAAGLLMTGGMTALALPSEFRADTRASKAYEAAKVTHLEKLNAHLRSIPGSKPLTAEDYDAAIAIYGGTDAIQHAQQFNEARKQLDVATQALNDAMATPEGRAIAQQAHVKKRSQEIAERQAEIDGKIGPRQDAQGNARALTTEEQQLDTELAELRSAETGPTPTRTDAIRDARRMVHEARQKFHPILSQMVLRETQAVNAVAELQTLPPQQRTLYTAVAKARLGQTEYTQEEADALNRLAGSQPTQGPPQPIRWVAAPNTAATQSPGLPDITTLPQNRLRLVPGSVPVIPNELLLEISEHATILGEMLATTATKKAQAEQQAQMQAQRQETTKTDILSAVEAFRQSNPNLQQILTPETKEEGTSGLAFTPDTMTIGYDVDRMVEDSLKGQSLGLFTPEQVKERVNQALDEEVQHLADELAAKNIFAEAIKDLPKPIQEALLDGVAIKGVSNPKARDLINSALGAMSPFSEEYAQFEADQKANDPNFTQPVTIYGAWKVAYYAVLASELTPDQIAKTRDAYGKNNFDKLPNQYKVREGIRMLSQIGMSKFGRITESLFRHVKATIDALKALLTNPPPNLRRHLDLMEQILVDHLGFTSQKESTGPAPAPAPTGTKEEKLDLPVQDNPAPPNPAPKTPELPLEIDVSVKTENGSEIRTIEFKNALDAQAFDVYRAIQARKKSTEANAKTAKQTALTKANALLVAVNNQGGIPGIPILTLSDIEIAVGNYGTTVLELAAENTSSLESTTPPTFVSSASVVDSTESELSSSLAADRLRKGTTNDIIEQLKYASQKLPLPNKEGFETYWQMFDDARDAIIQSRTSEKAKKNPKITAEDARRLGLIQKVKTGIFEENDLPALLAYIHWNFIGEHIDWNRTRNTLAKNLPADEDIVKQQLQTPPDAPLFDAIADAVKMRIRNVNQMGSAQNWDDVAAKEGDAFRRKESDQEKRRVSFLQSWPTEQSEDNKSLSSLPEWQSPKGFSNGDTLTIKSVAFTVRNVDKTAKTLSIESDLTGNIDLEADAVLPPYEYEALADKPREARVYQPNIVERVGAPERTPKENHRKASQFVLDGGVEVLPPIIVGTKTAEGITTVQYAKDGRLQQAKTVWDLLTRPTQHAPLIPFEFKNKGELLDQTEGSIWEVTFQDGVAQAAMIYTPTPNGYFIEALGMSDASTMSRLIGRKYLRRLEAEGWHTEVLVGDAVTDPQTAISNPLARASFAGSALLRNRVPIMPVDDNGIADLLPAGTEITPTTNEPFYTRSFGSLGEQTAGMFGKAWKLKLRHNLSPSTPNSKSSATPSTGKPTPTRSDSSSGTTGQSPAPQPSPESQTTATNPPADPSTPRNDSQTPPPGNSKSPNKVEATPTTTTPKVKPPTVTPTAAGWLNGPAKPLDSYSKSAIDKMKGQPTYPPLPPEAARTLILQTFGRLNQGIYPLHVNKATDKTPQTPLIRGRLLNLTINGHPHIATTALAFPHILTNPSPKKVVKHFSLMGAKDKWVAHIDHNVRTFIPNLDDLTDIYIEPFAGNLTYGLNLGFLNSTKKEVVTASAVEFEKDRNALYTAISKGGDDMLEIDGLLQGRDIDPGTLGGIAVRDLIKQEVVIRQKKKEKKRREAANESLKNDPDDFELMAEVPLTEAEYKQILSDAKEGIAKLRQWLSKPNIKVVGESDTAMYEDIRQIAESGQRVTLIDDGNYVDVPYEKTASVYVSEAEAKKAQTLIDKKMAAFRAVIANGGHIIFTNHPDYILTHALVQEFGDKGVWLGHSLNSQGVMQDLGLQAPWDRAGVSRQRPELLALLGQGVVKHPGFELKVGKWDGNVRTYEAQTGPVTAEDLDAGLPLDDKWRDVSEKVGLKAKTKTPKEKELERAVNNPDQGRMPGIPAAPVGIETLTKRFTKLFGEGTNTALEKAKDLWMRDKDFDYTETATARDWVAIGIGNGLAINTTYATRIAESMIAGRPNLVQKILTLQPIKEKELTEIGAYPSAITQIGYERQDRKIYTHPRAGQSMPAAPVSRQADPNQLQLEFKESAELFSMDAIDATTMPERQRKAAFDAIREKVTAHYDPYSTHHYPGGVNDVEKYAGTNDEPAAAVTSFLTDGFVAINNSPFHFATKALKRALSVFPRRAPKRMFRMLGFPTKEAALKYVKDFQPGKFAKQRNQFASWAEADSKWRDRSAMGTPFDMADQFGEYQVELRIEPGIEAIDFSFETMLGNESDGTELITEAGTVLRVEEVTKNANTWTVNMTPGTNQRTSALFAAPVTPPVELGFYSALQEAVATKMPARANAATVKGIVNNSGLKQEEVKWSGIIPWIESQPEGAPITKQQVLDYLRTEGSVQFKVTTLGNPQKTIYRIVTGSGRTQQTGFQTRNAAETARDELEQNSNEEYFAEAEQGTDELTGFTTAGNTARNTKWTTPGGTNHQEVVVTWEQPRIKQTWKPEQDTDESWFLRSSGGFADIKVYDTEEQAEAAAKAANAVDIGYIPQGSTPNNSGDTTHYGDLDALAWYRANDREGGLFIDEFQSKWHQMGRDKGYKSDITDGATDAEMRRFYNGKGDMPDAEWKALSQRVENQAKSESAVADAPFRKDWPLALFKRALRDAVASDKEWIGWTTGETQAERYDLSKQVQKLGATKNANGTYSLDAMQEGSGRYQEVASNVPEDKLADYVGKDLAKKIAEREIAPGNNAIFSGVDLKVGGEGMKGFYDTILPKEIGKYVKQWGARVEKGQINPPADPSKEEPYRIAHEDGRTLGYFETLEDARRHEGDGWRVIENTKATPIWRIDITDAMKKGVTEGQSLFAAPARAYESMDFTPPFKTKFGDILSYHWMSRPEGQFEVSDWSQARTNPVTGRKIVHHFKVKKGDEVSTVSLETAMGQLPDDDRAKMRRMIRTEQMKRWESESGQMKLFAAPVDISFASGIDKSVDLEGAMRAKAPLGTTAQVMQKNPGFANVFVDLLAKGTPVFIDSGAFSELTAGLTVDFPRVFEQYNRAATNPEHNKRLSVVAPDKVGDQAESLKRLIKYRPAVQHLIDKGVRVIVPVQSGELDMVTYLQRAGIDPSKVAIGIPANKKGYPRQLLRKHITDANIRDVHILGMSAANRDASQLASAMRESGVTNVTMDANRIRSAAGRIIKKLDPDSEEQRWNLDEVLHDTYDMFWDYPEDVQRKYIADSGVYSPEESKTVDIDEAVMAIEEISRGTYMDQWLIAQEGLEKMVTENVRVNQIADFLKSDQNKDQEAGDEQMRLFAAPAQLTPTTLFDEWGASVQENGILYGYRGELNAKGQDNGFGSSEGVGLYLVKERADAATFGPARRVAFPEPKNPIIVDEDGGKDTLPLLNEDNEQVWERIFSHTPKASDSDWMKAHIKAAKKIGLTEETWPKIHREMPRALTDELLSMGHDAVYTRSGGMEWVTLLAKTNERFNKGTRSPGGEMLYAAPASKEYTTEQAREMLAGTRMISTRSALDALGEYPEYLDAVASQILAKRDKLLQGKLTVRDVAKAYILTQGSIGSDARPTATIMPDIRAAGLNQNSGLDPLTLFQAADGSIRPEEITAWWLGTPLGQQALNDLEQGKVNQKAFEQLATVKRSFGKDNFKLNSVTGRNRKEGFQWLAAPDKGQFSLTNIEALTQAINDTKGDPQKLERTLLKINGISHSKKGFIGHMLGMGSMPTTDAVEYNFWLTGQGEGRIASLPKVIGQTLKALKENQSALNEEVYRRISTRIKELGKELGKKHSIDPDVLPHILHHWIWDKAKGIQTTHRGMYQAMSLYAAPAVITPDAATIKKLDSEPTVTRYRAMAMIEGKLYPPMSTSIGRDRRAPEPIGEWMQAEERPDLVPTTGPNAGKFRLKGPTGKDVWALYAPYFHSSQNPLNDQFSAAYSKPLVTVEIEIPAKDDYQAPGSKRPAGDHRWAGGRIVSLSRYAKIKRVVPDSEVAKLIRDSLPEGTLIPDNVVTPSLRKELEKVGVNIQTTGIVPALQAAPATAEQDAEYLAAVEVEKTKIADIQSKIRSLSDRIDAYWNDGTERLRKSGIGIDESYNLLSGTQELKDLQSAKDSWNSPLKKANSRLKSLEKEYRKVNYSIAPAAKARDADYLAAVEAGDIEKAQSMVDEAARMAGFTERMFHVTPFNFTTFRTPAEFADKDAAEALLEAYPNENLMRVFIDPKKVLDIRGRRDVDPDNKVELASFMDASGVDAVIAGSNWGGDGDLIVRNPSQIKSADPVTYDSSGAIIPLSQRFNPQSNSTLYAAPATADENTETFQASLAQMPPIWRDVLQQSMRGESIPSMARRMELSEVAIANILRNAQGRLTALTKAAEGNLKAKMRLEDGVMKYTGGRPDLAFGATPNYNAVDRERATPLLVKRSEMNEYANRLFEINPDQAERLVTHYLDTQNINDLGMDDRIRKLVADADGRDAKLMLMDAAAQLLITRKSLAGNDPVQIARLVHLIDSRRSNRTDLARALGMGVDPHMTPAERHAMVIASELLSPPRSIQLDIEKNPTNRETLLAKWAARSQRIKQGLLARGIDIDATFRYFNEIQQAARDTIPESIREPLSREERPEQVLTRALLEGATANEAAAAAGITMEQARTKYRSLYNRIGNGLKAFKREMTALEAAPTTDASNPLPTPDLFDNPDQPAVDTAATRKLKNLRSRPRPANTIDLNDPVDTAAKMQIIGSEKSTLLDYLTEYRRAAILTGPQTHVVNAVSSAAYGTYEATVKKLGTAAAADLGRLFGLKSDAASLADLPAMLAAVVPSVRSAFGDALRAWKANTRVFEAHAKAESLFNNTEKRDFDSPAMNGVVGRVMNFFSFRAMMLADQFMLSLFSRLEVAAQAHQIARTEGLSGQKMATRVKELMIPGSEAWLRGLEHGQKITFQTKLGSQNRAIDALDGVGKAIINANRGDYGKFVKVMSNLVFPFVSTPTNIFKQGMTIAPTGLFLGLVDAARSLDQRRKGNTQEARNLYSAARALDDLINQTVAWGSMLAVYSMIAPDDDDPDALPYLTGTLPWRATSKGERDIAYRTAPPQSIRIGGQWYSYRRLDPFATALAFVVDTLAEVRRGDNAFEALPKVGVNILNNFQDKTFMTGISDIMNAIQNPDRYGTKWATNVVTGFVPNLIRQPLRNADPTFRETDLPNDMGFIDSLAVRIGSGIYAPAFMPPKVDIWGRNVVKNTGTGSPETDILYRILTPAEMQDSDAPDPLDVALLRWNITNPQDTFDVVPPSRELKRTINGESLQVSLNDAAYTRMVQQAGQKARAAIGNRYSGRDLNQDDIDTIKKVLQSYQSQERERAFRENYRPPQSQAQPSGPLASRTSL